MTLDRSKAFSAPRPSKFIKLEIGQHVSGTLGDRITEANRFKPGETRDRYWFTIDGQNAAKLLPATAQLTDSVDAFVKVYGPRSRSVIERGPNDGQAHIYFVYPPDVLGLPSSVTQTPLLPQGDDPTPPPATQGQAKLINGEQAKSPEELDPFERMVPPGDASQKPAPKSHRVA